MGAIGHRAKRGWGAVRARGREGSIVDESDWRREMDARAGRMREAKVEDEIEIEDKDGAGDVGVKGDEGVDEGGGGGGGVREVREGTKGAKGRMA